MSRKKDTIESKFINRAWNMFLISIILYSFLLYRLVDIQIIDSDNYKEKVSNQSMQKIELNSGRGIIYDRNGKALTDVERRQIIIVEKEKLVNNYEIRELIKEVTKMDEPSIYKNIEKQINSSVVQLEVDKIDKKTKNKLEEKGLIVEEKVLRYSSDKLLSHTIGYIKSSDKIGQSGIEKSMNDILINSNEKYVSAFKVGDAGNTKNLSILKGSIKTINDNEESKHIKLTIDKDIQKKVEKIVSKEENPTAVVISDVDTGEILSMSSRPTFDLNNISTNKESNDGEFINRTIQATYPPGSVFKIVVLYAALENNVIDENNYSYNCIGNAKIGISGESLNCNKLDGHGIQNLQQAFSNSCNTAFLDIAIKAGQDNIIKSAKKLHLDEKVEIGLEEEKIREIPTQIAIRNLAIGQGDIEFTPLQINQMTQIIANNGTYKPLYLYDSIIDKNKNMIKRFKTSKSESIISPYTLTIIKEMMKDVSKEGTGKNLKDLDGGCGVKTGTAQSIVNGNDINHGWISGFYPEDRPKYVITVLVEGTAESSKSAIPIFEDICQKLNKK
ncbi:MAG: penicillin-binding protein 2 [Romboutsia sp.]